MKIRRTIPIVIEQDADLADTIILYTKAQNIASVYCFNDGGKPLTRNELQDVAYRDIRSTGILSQMACSVCRSVAAAYVVHGKKVQDREKKIARAEKSAATRGKLPQQIERRVIIFNHPSALLLIGKDSRDAEFKPDGVISTRTVAGRKKLTYRVPKPFQGRFGAAFSFDSLTLFIESGMIKARLALTLDVLDPVGTHPVGVDLNETNLVVAVNQEGGEFIYDGIPLKAKSKRKRQVRKRVQRKLDTLKAQGQDTHSVRRLLKRLGKTQANRIKNECRVAAKTLTSWVGEDVVLVLEDLHPKPVSRQDFTRKKETRRRMNSGFPYLQLRQAIESRCALLGIPVEFVNPAYTSQRCSACGEIGTRNRHKFDCPACGHTDHADVNAARNLKNMSSHGATGCKSISPKGESHGARSCGQAVIAS